MFLLCRNSDKAIEQLTGYFDRLITKASGEASIVVALQQEEQGDESSCRYRQLVPEHALPALLPAERTGHERSHRTTDIDGLLHGPSDPSGSQ